MRGEGEGLVRDGPARLEPGVLEVADVRLRFFWKKASGIVVTKV